jgi:hypothetical protein
MRATTEGAEILRSGNSLPRRAIALGYAPSTVRRLAQAPPTPFLDGRKSVARSTPDHATPICNPQTTEGAEILRSGEQPAPSRQSLSATLPHRAPARASTADPVSRWSKIGRIARPRQYAVATTEGAEILRSGNSPAPSRHALSATLPHARGRNRRQSRKRHAGAVRRPSLSATSDHAPLARHRRPVFDGRNRTASQHDSDDALQASV